MRRCGEIFFITVIQKRPVRHHETHSLEVGPRSRQTPDNPKIKYVQRTAVQRCTAARKVSRDTEYNAYIYRVLGSRSNNRL